MFRAGSKGPPQKKERKNRLGQRARQALAEQIHKDHARHVVNPEFDRKKKLTFGRKSEKPLVLSHASLLLVAIIPTPLVRCASSPLYRILKGYFC